jgi:MFS family permease
MTLVAIWLLDKIGRKPLLYIGMAGMCLSLAVLGLAFNTATIIRDTQMDSRGQRPVLYRFFRDKPRPDILADHRRESIR